MFGIKSKKDKEIEKLKKELETLKSIITPKLDTNTYVSEFVVPIEALNSISEKAIKTVLVTKMNDAIEQNLEIRCNTDMLNQVQIYKAKLEIVKGVNKNDN